MELNFGADFDEDLFDVKPQRKSNDRSEAIKNYRPKQVQSRTFYNESSAILEDIANSFKLKGDLEYYGRNFQAALEFYEKSFETSRKSTSLNETIFQRELAESTARCLFKLSRFDDAIKAVQKLEESSVNFEQYSTSLNLHLNILEETKRNNNSDDKSKAMIAIVLCKLVLMHPMSSNLWQKLTDSFIELDLADFASNAFSFVKELAKFSPNSTNEIYVRNRLNVNSWIEAKANVISSMLKSEEESFKNSENVSYTPLNERLEKLDKWEDNHKLKVALQFDDFKKFFTLF